MKKGTAMITAVMIVIIATISYIYWSYQTKIEISKKENSQFESYYQQEIYGPDLATLINKAIDNNTKNEIQKDNKGLFIENNSNSIKIDIKFTDDDKTHSMEEIYNGEISRFINYYNQIKFKCTQIEYHKSNNKIKYMLFEQITS